MKRIIVRYCLPDLYDKGFSASSNESVMRTALRVWLRKGGIPTREDVAKEALKLQRQLTGGRAVAANDIYPISFGGILAVYTYPVTIVPEPILNAEEWLGDHLCIAFNQNSERHGPMDLLETFFHDKEAGRDFVRECSKFAEIAGNAIKARNLLNLAHAMSEYRREVDARTNKAYTSRTRAIIRKLEKELPSEVISWKPPGTGGCESLIVLSPDREARDKVIQYLHRQPGWDAAPVNITGGVSMETLPGNKLRITAGYRLDLVGAADVGQDPTIGQKGCCISCAIEPRAEILLDRN